MFLKAIVANADDKLQAPEDFLSRRKVLQLYAKEKREKNFDLFTFFAANSEERSDDRALFACWNCCRLVEIDQLVTVDTDG